WGRHSRSRSDRTQKARGAASHTSPKFSLKLRKEQHVLDSLFFANSRAEKYYDDPHYNIWKFPAKPEAGKPQEKPIVLNYSIMTRAYGACFNDDSFIDIFNHHGFDVYLMDWGKDFPAAITGWRLDDLAGKL